MGKLKMDKVILFPLTRLLSKLSESYNILENNSYPNSGYAKDTVIKHEFYGFDKGSRYPPADLNEKKFSIYCDKLSERLSDTLLYYPYIYIENTADEEESEKIRKIAERYADIFVRH